MSAYLGNYTDGTARRHAVSLTRQPTLKLPNPEIAFLSRAESFCSAAKVPLFRLNSFLSEIMELDEQQDYKIINCLWETKRFMYYRKDQVKTLANYLERCTRGLATPAPPPTPTPSARTGGLSLNRASKSNKPPSQQRSTSLTVSPKTSKGAVPFSKSKEVQKGVQKSSMRQGKEKSSTAVEVSKSKPSKGKQAKKVLPSESKTKKSLNSNETRRTTS